MATLPKWANVLMEYNNTADDGGENIDSDYSEKLGLQTVKLFESQKNNPTNDDCDSRKIPTFFTADENIDLKANESLIALSEMAKELFLDHSEESLLSEHDLNVIFNNMVTLFQESQSLKTTEMNSKDTNENLFLDYSVFTELKESLPKRAHKFFTPAIFRKFVLNKYGELRGESFHIFISLAVNLLQQFITLSRYDISSNNANCKGVLTESDLEIFVSDQIEMIPALMNIDTAFHPYYIYHAVRKFMFCFGAKKEIQITKILCSDIFRDFNEFRFDRKESKIDFESKSNTNNWFYVENALRVYKLYLELDCDHNGTLSQKEMLQFNGSSMSNLFIQRIFQYKKTWDGELDYKGFLNFVLAVEHKHLIQSLNYFWDILDLDECGYLTPLTLQTLFRSVQKKMGIFGWIEPVDAQDVINEIIDMVHPANEHQITKKDLINSKLYSTVINILTDVKGFWEYDNRESLVANQQ